MSPKAVVNPVGVAALAALAFAVVNPVSARGASDPDVATARARLAAADAEARKWQADAVLVQVDTSTANPDGTAYMWMYLYDSPGAHAQAAVMVGDDGASLHESPVTAFHTPLGEWIDSDKAMAAAVAAGMKTSDYGMRMALSRSERAEWFMSDADFSYTIDGTTGKLVSKE